ADRTPLGSGAAALLPPRRAHPGPTRGDPGAREPGQPKIPSLRGQRRDRGVQRPQRGAEAARAELPPLALDALSAEAALRPATIVSPRAPPGHRRSRLPPRSPCTA